MLHNPCLTPILQVTEEERQAGSLARVLQWLEELGPQDGALLTNGKVLEVLGLQEKAATSKLISLIINMVGIHPDWVNSRLRDKFRDYLAKSKTSLRPLLEAEPDAPWLYLARLTRTDGLGDLRHPVLLSPKAPQSKVAKLLQKTLEKHGEGEQQCHSCKRLGDLSLCGCLAVTFCNSSCQEQDEDHTKVCLYMGEENVVLLPRSDQLYRQQANKLKRTVKEKVEMIKGMKVEMARKTKKLEQARAKLNLGRRVSLVERSLGKVPRLRRGNLTVALSISKKEGVARITSLPHPGLKLWLGQLEVDPNSPALPAPAPRAALSHKVPGAEPALPTEVHPEPALPPAAGQDQLEPALPPAPEDAVPPAPEDALLPAPEDALPPAPEGALPPVPDQGREPVPIPAPEDALPPAAVQDHEMVALPPAVGDTLEDAAVAAPAPAAEKSRPAPPRYSRKDKRVLVDLGRAATPMSKVHI